MFTYRLILKANKAVLRNNFVQVPASELTRDTYPQ
jgi:hypothetical protein